MEVWLLRSLKGHRKDSFRPLLHTSTNHGGRQENDGKLQTQVVHTMSDVYDILTLCTPPSPKAPENQ